MSSPSRIALAAYLVGTGMHIASWRQPAAQADASIDLDFYRREYAGFTHEKGRPHAEVLALMRSCDVFCLPSIVEGRALVMQEAMSQGLPIVITPNTGGADLVVEGETGFLVPIRSPEQIAAKLAWLNQHRPELVAMKDKAAQHAAAYSWKRYGEVVVDAIRALA